MSIFRRSRAFSLWRTEVSAFSEKQIELVKTFADQAVIAIENVRLFKELGQRNQELTEALERQTATSEVLRVISGSPTDVQPVFETILEMRAASAACSSALESLSRSPARHLEIAWSGDCQTSPRLHPGSCPQRKPKRPKAVDVRGANLRDVVCGALAPVVI